MPITPRTMREILARTPVMPILTIHDASTAGDLAQALVKGGIHVFEVVMRTPQAVAAVKAMREATPEADIGMGTLMTPEDVIRAHHAGAQFGVSPGLTPELAQAIQAHRMAFLPGVATASEVMQARAFGLKELKYFPAQGPIGAAWLKDMSQVFPDVIFCPTGGIRPPHIPDYLALPNCSTVGGS
jgi:2-dehydro-3-deoxyphosphogluconate aldolase/(4S)-4-hydroxy-2-oxoglutarate aldolase